MNNPYANPSAQDLGKLDWPHGLVDLVLDTDTYNEIDDQFAVAYALLSRERLRVRALYAAPFHNKRSSGPAEGMERSYEEIHRVLERLNLADPPPVFRGSEQWLPDRQTPVQSPAVQDLVKRARRRKGKPLYVVAIGALTNIASALLAAPDIAGKIVVVWLGGHPTYWHTTDEFNLQGDWNASRFLFDCGVPLVVFPCTHVVAQLLTTQAEMARFVKGRGPLGDYLFQIFSDYEGSDLKAAGASKQIWDLAPLAWLVNHRWFRTALVHSPILSRDLTWSHDPSRHFIREARFLFRDHVFADFFAKLDAASAT